MKTSVKNWFSLLGRPPKPMESMDLACIDCRSSEPNMRTSEKLCHEVLSKHKPGVG